MGSVTAYGAIGDGVTDDSAAFLSALATDATVYAPWTPNGYNLGSTSLTVGDDQTLIGENRVRLKSSATDFINITGYNNSCVVENFLINMSAAPPASTAIRLKTSAGVVWKPAVRNIHFVNCPVAVQDEVSVSNYVVEFTLEDCRMLYTRGRQIRLRRTRGFIDLKKIEVDHTFNTAPVTFESMRFDDNAGLDFTQVGVVGGSSLSGYQAGATGIVINGGFWARMNGVLIDNISGTGILISNLDNVEAVNIESSFALGDGINLVNVTNSGFTNVKQRGNAAMVGGAAGSNGIGMTGCSFVSMANVQADGNSGNGIVRNNSFKTSLCNIQADINNNYGVIDVGTSNQNIIIGMRATGNGVRALQQSGVESASHFIYGTAGTYTGTILGNGAVA